MDRESYRAAPTAKVTGSITVPGDKSISHRALLFNAIARGVSTVRGLLEAEDCLATITALRRLGVPVERQEPGHYRVTGVGPDGLKPANGPLDLGNSGTALRLLAGVLAGRSFDSVLTGDASLRRRPMERIAEPLNAMGAQLATEGGCPPISIRGGNQLRGIKYALPVASAQVKSALLLAALDAQGTTALREPAPSRDHTERLFRAMGIDLKQNDGELQLTGPASLTAIDIVVPGDFSSAAFFIVAGCLGADERLTVRNVGLNPSRIGLLAALDLMGADIRLLNRSMIGGEPIADIEVRKTQLRGAEIPATLVPLAIDEFPVLFIAAAGAAGATRMSGAAELRHKESDRIKAMVEGLTALGVTVEELDDGAIIHGGGMGGGYVDSHGDHRVAMAFVMASLLAREEIHVENTANVATSFPDFAGLAAAVGVGLEVVRE